jgi:hypothetical protein
MFSMGVYSVGICIIDMGFEVSDKVNPEAVPQFSCMCLIFFLSHMLFLSIILQNL